MVLEVSAEMKYCKDDGTERRQQQWMQSEGATHSVNAFNECELQQDITHQLRLTFNRNGGNADGKKNAVERKFGDSGQTG